MHEGNILSVYLGGPDATGEQVVERPASLKGLWLNPHSSSDVNLKFYNITAAADKAASNLLLDIDVPTGLATGGYTIPANGIRFDTAIWIQGAATTIEAMTVFYQ